MRQESQLGQLEDVEIITIGKDKPTLSWVGVPMRCSHIDGVMAISSYRPNAFNRSDMELLSTIAQRAALALDNTSHHTLVKEQARLDSLTRVYNHGYFIQNLREQSKVCLEKNQPLSLIMLDIDYFKQYAETDDVTKLIDLADKRLCIAKERGWDQIEPAPAFLEKIK